MFALYANCLRRESALFYYDADSLFRCFPQGYAPGGINFPKSWSTARKPIGRFPEKTNCFCA